MSFPDGKMDPPDSNVCRACGRSLEDLDDRDFLRHVWNCDPKAEREEIRAESEREEGPR